MNNMNIHGTFSGTKEAMNSTVRGFEVFAKRQNDFVQNINTITQSYSSLAEVARRYYENNTRLFEAVDSFNRNVNAFLEYNLDYSKMFSALTSVLESMEDGSNHDFEEIVDKTADQYESDSDYEEEIIEEIKDVKNQQNEKRKEFSAILKKILLYFLFVLMPIMIDNGIQTVLQNNPPEVNQYYIQNVTNTIAEEGYNIDELDGYGYRIVSEDSMPRQKPDRSSRVTGHLKKGDVVRVVGKYKKWLEITWVDIEGNETYGWIQNYRLTGFAGED
ncbi:MAG: hypothetical protein IJJ01_09430 [Firmicutes bacterium]|nr:hypothetical protein [Bacillota bacterium]